MSPAIIAATALALTTLLTACGNEGSTPPVTTGTTEEIPVQTADPTPIATPTATSTPTATEIPDPTATPEPTPRMVTGACPSERENAGQEYEFDLGEMSRLVAVEMFCGPVFTSAWLTHETVDELTGTRFMFADSIAVDHDIEMAFEAAFLRVLCLSNDGESDLAVFVYPAGKFILGHRDSFYRDAEVLYRFNDNPLVEDYWQVENSELFVLYPEKYRAFVRYLRGGGELIFRGWTDHDDAATMTFDLTGVERDVEPVLQECGY